MKRGTGLLGAVALAAVLVAGAASALVDGGGGGPAAGPAAGAEVSLSASNATPAVGESFTVTVNLTGAEAFANWAAYLKFDKSKLKLTGQATGTFTTFIADARSLGDINASGEIRAGGFGFADNAGGAGSLGVFTFEALAAGSTSVTTENKSAGNSFGNVLKNMAGGETLPAIAGALSIDVGGSGGNAAPVAQGQSVTTDEDTARAITLVATDGDGDALTYAVVSGPANGSLSGTAPSLTYTPNAGYSGADSFTFKANDGTDDSNVATVSITVNAAGPGAEVSLSASDANPTVGDSFTVTVNLTGAEAFANWAAYLKFDKSKLKLTGQATGTFTTFIADARSLGDINASGEIRAGGFGFADNAGGAGSLGVFTFEALAAGSTSVTTENKSAGNSFGNVLKNMAGAETLPGIAGPLAINIGAAANNAPVAQGQSVTTPEDTAKSITLVATDADGDALTYAVVSGPANGSLSGTAPSLTYTPNAGYAGADSFTFKANDGTDDSNTATVSVTVTNVNVPPVSDDVAVSTLENTPVPVTLVASDADGDALSYVVVSGPANGSLSGTAPDLTYTPDAGYVGGDSFTYKANDGTDDSNVATVSITVDASGVALVTLVASDSKPAVGERFTVTVELTGADPFANWATYLKFDKAKLELTAQAAGDFATFVPDARDLAEINASGEIRAGGFGLTDNAGGAGNLAVFTFKALAEGSTELTTENKSASNSFGNVLTTHAGVDTLPGIDGPLGIDVAAEGGNGSGGGGSGSSKNKSKKSGGGGGGGGGGCSLSAAGDAGAAGWLLPWIVAAALRVLSALKRRRSKKS